MSLNTSFEILSRPNELLTPTDVLEMSSGQEEYKPRRILDYSEMEREISAWSDSEDEDEAEDDDEARFSSYSPSATSSDHRASVHTFGSGSLSAPRVLVPAVSPPRPRRSSLRTPSATRTPPAATSPTSPGSVGSPLILTPPTSRESSPSASSASSRRSRHRQAACYGILESATSTETQMPTNSLRGHPLLQTYSGESQAAPSPPRQETQRGGRPPFRRAHESFPRTDKIIDMRYLSSPCPTFCQRRKLKILNKFRKFNSEPRSEFEEMVMIEELRSAGLL